MNPLIVKKTQFIFLTFLSMSCLISSFVGNLGAYKVYKFPNKALFSTAPSQYLVHTEFDLNYPLGFDHKNSKIIYRNINNYLYLKLFCLAGAIIIPWTLLSLFGETFDDIENSLEAQEISKEARKEIALTRIKNRFALLAKSQQLSFIEEITALADIHQETEFEKFEAEYALESKYVAAASYISEGFSEKDAVTLAWGLQQDDPSFTEYLEKFKIWQKQEIKDEPNYE